LSSKEEHKKFQVKHHKNVLLPTYTMLQTIRRNDLYPEKMVTIMFLLKTTQPSGRKGQ
jgi:hypothetical protein